MLPSRRCACQLIIVPSNFTLPKQCSHCRFRSVSSFWAEPLDRHELSNIFIPQIIGASGHVNMTRQRVIRLSMGTRSNAYPGVFFHYSDPKERMTRPQEIARIIDTPISMGFEFDLFAANLIPGLAAHFEFGGTMI